MKICTKQVLSYQLKFPHLRHLFYKAYFSDASRSKFLTQVGSIFLLPGLGQVRSAIFGLDLENFH